MTTLTAPSPVSKRSGVSNRPSSNAATSAPSTVGTWSSDTNLPSNNNSQYGPATAVWTDPVNGETLFCVYASTNSGSPLQWLTYLPPGGTNPSGWTSPPATIPDGGNAASSTAQPALVTNIDGLLYLVYKGANSDTNLYWTTYNGSWASNPQPIPNVVSDSGPALAVFNDGLLYCAYQGPKNQIYYVTYDTVTQTWSSASKSTPPTAMSNACTSAEPALAAFGDGTLYCVYGNQSNNDDMDLYYTAFSSGAWSTPSAISGNSLTCGPRLAVFNGYLNCIYKGTDTSSMYMITFDGSTWQPWNTSSGSHVPGTTTSGGPALTAFQGNLWVVHRNQDSDQSLAALYEYFPASWMTSSKLGSKTLNQIVLPGTHDSGAYSLGNTVDPFGDAPDLVKAINPNLPVGTGVTVSDIIRAGSLTQSMSVGEQLAFGVRFIDLRVIYLNNQFYTGHGLIGDTIDAVFADVANFMASPTTGSNEIVIIVASHMKSFQKSDTVHEEFIKNHILTGLGNYLYPRASTSTGINDATIGTITANGPQIVFFYDDDFMKKNAATYPQLWYQDQIVGDYANTDAYSTMEANVLSQLTNSTNQAALAVRSPVDPHLHGERLRQPGHRDSRRSQFSSGVERECQLADARLRRGEQHSGEGQHQEPDQHPPRGLHRGVGGHRAGHRAEWGLVIRSRPRHREPRRRGPGPAPISGGDPVDTTWLSVRVARHDLAAGDRAQCPPDRPRDRALDEPHAAIAEQRIHAAGVVAAGGNRCVGRPAVVLVRRSQVGIDRGRAGQSHGVWRQRRGETIVERIAIGPVGVPRGQLAQRGGRGDHRADGGRIGLRIGTGQ